MARDEAPPFARGETYANGNLEILNADTGPYGFGGINLEGKEYVFEPNSDAQGVSYNSLGSDPSGRPIRVKVVRNVSGVNLKPARLAHFSAASTSTPYETRVDGYCTTAASRPAGVVDELLPAAGVPNNDLFYLVVSGPTQVTNQTSAPITTAIGDRLIPAATGSTAGDDLAGRVDLQANVLTAGTTNVAFSAIGNAIENRVGYAASVNSTTSARFNAVVDLRF